MNKYNHVYALVRDISKGNYQLSCSEPLTQVTTFIDLVINYKPTSEENIFLRSEVLKTLKRWKGDLILGQAKK